MEAGRAVPSAPGSGVVVVEVLGVPEEGRLLSPLSPGPIQFHHLGSQPHSQSFSSLSISFTLPAGPGDSRLP